VATYSFSLSGWVQSGSVFQGGEIPVIKKQKDATVVVEYARFGERSDINRDSLLARPRRASHSVRLDRSWSGVAVPAAVNVAIAGTICAQVRPMSRVRHAGNSVAPTASASAVRELIRNPWRAPRASLPSATVLAYSPATMIPILRWTVDEERRRVESLLRRLALDPAEVALGHGDEAAAVRQTLADVKERGDAAIVDSARRFDDASFTADQIRVQPDEMAAAAARVPDRELAALRRRDRTGPRVSDRHPPTGAGARPFGRAWNWGFGSRRWTARDSIFRAEKQHIRRA
jgi:hypothetical protein